MQSKRVFRFISDMINRWELNDLISSFQANLLKVDLEAYLAEKRRKLRRLIWMVVGGVFALIGILAIMNY